jgi:hypothetical protein
MLLGGFYTEVPRLGDGFWYSFKSPSFGGLVLTAHDSSNRARRNSARPRMILERTVTGASRGVA